MKAECAFAKVGFWEGNMKSPSNGMPGVVAMNSVSRQEKLLKVRWVDAMDSLKDMLCQMKFVAQSKS